jgi:hypothetical protein
MGQSKICVEYCQTCGDYLFNGRHRGNVERWCLELRETKTPETEIPLPQGETNIQASGTETVIRPETNIRRETEIQPKADETKNRRGRPRRKTVAPWVAAGISRASWYRQKKRGTISKVPVNQG